MEKSFITKVSIFLKIEITNFGVPFMTSADTINPPMAKGVDATPPPTGFSNFSQKWEKLSLETKFLPVGSSLGHLSMKKFFRSDLPSWL